MAEAPARSPSRSSRTASSPRAVCSSLSRRMVSIDAFSCCQCAVIPSRCSAEVGQLRLQPLQALVGGLVGLLLQRHLLDLELADAPDHLVQLGRQGVDLDAQLARRLVDQVDGLVGQEAPRDVAVRKDGGGDQRRILDAHAVVDLVALGQPAQDGDGVLHRGLAHEDRLEPALQGGVLLDRRPVLVERGGADEPELAARQHGLDHLPGVHRPFGRARARRGCAPRR